MPKKLKKVKCQVCAGKKYFFINNYQNGKQWSNKHDCPQCTGKPLVITFKSKKPKGR